MITTSPNCIDMLTRIQSCRPSLPCEEGEPAAVSWWFNWFSIVVFYLYLFKEIFWLIFALYINIIASPITFCLRCYNCPGARCVPSGENQQKNNECPPLWTDFHKVTLQNISTHYMRQKHWIGHNFSPTFMYISHNFCTKFTHITHNQTTHSFHHFHISLTPLSHNFHTAFTNLWHDFFQWDKCWASSIEEEDSSTCWEEGGCWSKVKWI